MACKGSDDSLTTRGSTSRLVCDNTDARLITHRQPGSVAGRRSRPDAGRTPRAGAGVPAASGSRSGRRRRAGRARCWRPPGESLPGRRRAAPSGAAIGRPRSGSCQVPTDQAIEHKFESRSATLRSPPGRSEPGWAVLGPQLSGTWEDSRGQQWITNLEVSGRSERLTWAAKPLK